MSEFVNPGVVPAESGIQAVVRESRVPVFAEVTAKRASIVRRRGFGL